MNFSEVDMLPVDYEKRRRDAVRFGKMPMKPRLAAKRSI